MSSVRGSWLSPSLAAAAAIVESIECDACGDASAAATAKLVEGDESDDHAENDRRDTAALHGWDFCL